MAITAILAWALQCCDQCACCLCRMLCPARPSSKQLAPSNLIHSVGVMDEEEEEEEGELNQEGKVAFSLADPSSTSATTLPANTATFAPGTLEQGVGAYSTAPFEFSVGGASHSKPPASSGGGAGGKKFIGAFVSKLGSMSKDLDAKMERANK